MTSSNLWIKVVLISSVVISVAITMKLAVPVMLNFAMNDLPVIWSIIISWLKPPYLYLLINVIIITIAASTRFHQNNNPPPLDLTSKPPLSSVMETSPVPVVYETFKSHDLDVKTAPEVDATISTWHLSESDIKSPLPPNFIYPVREKQILTSRFSHNKKPTPHGARALRVLKPKKHETMDNTWKMITDGRHKPLNKHLRKSDTFVNIQHSPSTTKDLKKVVKKSETFKDRTNYENENQYLQPMMSRGNLNKDNSLSHDELNNRVEAFIKKFNDDMRLQRQQSLNQYRDMLKSGLH